MPDVCPQFIKVLKRLQKSTKPVTLFITAGEDCCKITGCVAKIVDDCFVVLLNNNNDECTRTYVRIKCICAIKDPADNNLGNVSG